MLKVRMESKNLIKAYIPMFSYKFDADFSLYQMVAYLKMGE